MPFLMCSDIDSQRLEAETKEEAIEIFKKKVSLEKTGVAIKDYYLCEIIAVDANWNEHPHGFTTESDILRSTTGGHPDELKPSDADPGSGLGLGEASGPSTIKHRKRST